LLLVEPRLRRSVVVADFEQPDGCPPQHADDDDDGYPERSCVRRFSSLWYR
jgi:hypothetical protein